MYKFNLNLPVAGTTPPGALKLKLATEKVKILFFIS
jgi:hypothetical protein